MYWLRTGFLLLIVISVISLPLRSSGQGTTSQAHATRSEGLAAWQQIYSVVTHPRCLNCHTAKNYPEQGDDRHRHQFNVVRGPEGRGVPGLTCATCHQGAFKPLNGVSMVPDYPELKGPVAASAEPSSTGQ